MTALRPLAAPTGLRPGDHLCWTFADDAEFSAAVTSFLDEGRRCGERLLATGETRTGLLEQLRGLPDRDAVRGDAVLRPVPRPVLLLHPLQQHGDRLPTRHLSGRVVARCLDPVGPVVEGGADA